MIIPFGELAPDASRYKVGATSVAVNCLPVADGWGPMPTLSAFTTGLGAEPRGVTLVRTSAGGYQIYAGTETALKKLNTGVVPNAWSDVSRLVGGAYAVPPGDRWSFTKYGQRLIAAELADVIQYIDIDSGTNFALLPGSPPQAKFVWVAGDFLVTGYNSSFPYRVRWSAFNNSESWTLQVRGAGLQDILAGNEVSGGIGSARGAIVMQRNAIASMVKTVNVSSAFDFSNVLNEYRGTIAPYGVAVTNSGQIFYPSDDGFYQGAEGAPIGAERVDRWFFNTDIDRSYLAEIRAMVDPFSKIVWFNYRKVGGARALLGYNWQLDRWCYSDQNVMEIAALATAGLTWDGLDSLYANINAVDEPFDSRLFQGGVPVLAAFNASDFTLGTFTGPSAAVTLETADVQLQPAANGKPGKRSTLGKARLVGDCSEFTLKVGMSDYPGGPVTWSSASTPFDRNGVCGFGSGKSALFHRFRLEIPAGAEWNVVTGIEPLLVTDGGDQ